MLPYKVISSELDLSSPTKVTANGFQMMNMYPGVNDTIKCLFT